MQTDSPFAVILPAAGTGSRFGAGDKLLLELGGKTVLRRAIDLFATREDVSQILVVTAPERMEEYRHHLANCDKPVFFTAGGRERWESVLFGLRFLTGGAGTTGQKSPEWVAIHDAARPLTPREVISEAFRLARISMAVVPAIAEPATLKRRAPDGTVDATIERKHLFQAQTPQCFAFGALLSAYEQLARSNQLADITDDAQVCERTGTRVQITAGSALNLKITTTEDVALARAILMASG